MPQSPLVSKTDFRIDLERLQKEVSEIILKAGFHPSAQQIGLTHTPDCAPENRFHESVGSLYNYKLDRFDHHERDFCLFNQDLKGSYCEWIYHNVPFKVARMRLMRMPPRKCLSIHDDTGPRYHIAIKTNPSSYLFFPETKEVFQIPLDGHLYHMDATRPHTAFNADLNEDRIHLVFSDFNLS